MSFESTAAVKMCPHGGHTLTFRTGRAKYITHAVGVDITAAQPRYNFSRSEKYNLRRRRGRSRDITFRGAKNITYAESVGAAAI